MATNSFQFTSLLVLWLLMPSDCSSAVAGGSGGGVADLGAGTTRMDPLLAASLLSNSSNSPASSAEGEVWAAVRLRLPLHAQRALARHRKELPFNAQVQMNWAIAQLKSEECSNTVRLLLDYYTKGDPSNNVRGVHLSSLSTIGSTNSPATNQCVFEGESPPEQWLSAQGKHWVIIIRISEQGLARACSERAFTRLFQEASFVAELRREQWTVCVCISPSQPEQSMSFSLRPRESAAARVELLYVPSRAATMEGAVEVAIQEALEGWMLKVYYEQMKTSLGPSDK